MPLEPELEVRRRGGELPAPRELRLSPELHDHLDWAPPARRKVRSLYGLRLGLSPRLRLGMRVEKGVDGKRLKFLRDVLGQGLEAAQGLPGGLHGAQAQRVEAAQDGGSVVEKVVNSPRTPSSAAAA